MSQAQVERLQKLLSEARAYITPIQETHASILARIDAAIAEPVERPSLPSPETVRRSQRILQVYRDRAIAHKADPNLPAPDLREVMDYVHGNPEP